MKIIILGLAFERESYAFTYIFKATKANLHEHFPRLNRALDVYCEIIDAGGAGINYHA